MKLIASLTSPFARKIRILLHEKQLPFELVVDIPWNEDTQVPAYNPLGKVPVLLTDDGECIYDSRVIAEYLEGLPGASFIPADWRERVAVRRLEALADGVADAAATVFLERKRPPAQVSGTWVARQLGKIDQGLSALAAALPEAGGYLSGSRLTLADMAAVSTLGYLDLRFPELEWRDRYPGLKAYQAMMSRRSSVAETMPPQ